ncbi:uncharacterized protein PV06_08305 [Exophiala oligosperma]|uniref:RNase H type-1 domain-containing protein n=1 Tax=Exophiala oligosperma TaxID=215243 RepID=A0A0D2AHU2_9EURO|nr:uncharacterized protein PV06_08305 [Exophiala oligosperma]KIW39716.1 hypothetical protein PV06_08305 [Exophiala oligosperma]
MWKVGIGSRGDWTVPPVELIAIRKATEILKMRTVNEPDMRKALGKTTTMISDSQSAIQAIANSRNLRVYANLSRHRSHLLT